MFNLIIPPISDCFMPTLGAAQIKGYLRSKGIKGKLYDISSEFCDYMLNEFKFEDEFIDKIIKNSTTEYAKYRMVLQWITRGEPYEISPDHFQYPIKNDINNLKNFIADKRTKIYGILSKLKSVSEIAERGGFVGISISYNSQWILAFLIAKIIKEKNPSVKIILGGSFFNDNADIGSDWLHDLDFVDYIIAGKGEFPIYHILNNQIDELDNNKKIEIKQFGERYFFDTRNLNTNEIVYQPDFSDIDFNKYPSKQKFFPYIIRSRCYYGKCGFCDGDKSLCIDRNKETKEAFENIIKISKQIGVKNVYLVDAAIAPSDCEEIVKLPDGNMLNWIANARFEKAFLKEGFLQSMAEKGCKMLRFGLESGSQRVLDLMNKGTDILVVENILKKMHEAGIKNHIYIMFGYLGETSEDREETLKFLRKNKQYISSYAISMFEPIPSTPVYRQIESILKCEKENITENDVFEYVYPTNELISEIMNYIDKAKSLLGSNTQYDFSDSSSLISAKYTGTSIFEYLPNKVFINKNMILTKDLYLRLGATLSKKVYINCSLNEKKNEYVIFDLYNDAEIHLECPDWMIENITMYDNIDETELITQLNQKLGEDKSEFCQALLSKLSEISYCVLNYSKKNSSSPFNNIKR